MAKEVLLKSKLFIPPLRAHYVDRPRLYDLLTAKQHYKLTVVCAPAGFGKTTLVTSWLSKMKKRTAWVSLTSSDNDLMSFLSYLVAAIELHEPEVGEHCQGMLGSFTQISDTSILIPLVNQLATLKQPLSIVFDDYHVIHSENVHRSLQFLIDNLSPQVNILITSRQQIPIALSKLRAKAQLLELSLDDLRFTVEETAKFLDYVMDLSLSKGEISNLNKNTEGWVTGLQLAALSLKRSVSYRSHVDSVTGASQYIADYLVDEVLSNQPKGIHDFLLVTSILEQFSAPLCDAVVKSENSSEILKTLEQENLFLIPLDAEGVWFRYHHLFGELLHSRLTNQFPGIDKDLHHRACEWYRENGRTEQAIYHALASEDYQLSVDLILGIADQTWTDGRLETLLNWIESIPSAQASRYPRIGIYHVWALYLLGRYQQAEQKFLLLEQQTNISPDSPDSLPPNPQERTLLGEIAVMKTVAYENKFDDEELLQLALLAKDYLPDNSPWHDVNWINLGIAYENKSENSKAAQAYEKAYWCSIQDQKRIYMSAASSAFLATVQIKSGDYIGAIKTCQRLFTLVSVEFNCQIPFLGILHALYGYVNFQRRDFSLALKHTKTAMNFDYSIHNTEFIQAVNFMYGKIKLAQGKQVSEREFHNFLNMDSDSGVTEIAVAQTKVLHAASALLRGDIVTAAQWADLFEIPDPQQDRYVLRLGTKQEYSPAYELIFPFGYSYALELITFTRIQYSRGKYNESKDAIQFLLTSDQKFRSYSETLQAWYLLALTHWQLNERTKAFEAAQKAITQAKEQQITQPFFQETKASHDFLSAILNDETAKEGFDSKALAFTQHLVETLSIEQTSIEDDSDPLLSERELEVLHLIAEGLSNSEIEQRLILTKNTVRSHIKSINRKLGAQNRVQAINKARELHIF